MVKAKKFIEDVPQKVSQSIDNLRLKLDKNENIYGISNFIVGSIKNMDFDEISKYPNYQNTIENFSNYYQFPKSKIFMVNRSEEALRAVFDCYFKQDDNAVFYRYENDVFPYLKGLNITTFYDDIENAQSYINENTKIFYLATPDIYKGETVKPALIEALVKKYQDTLFIINCAFINFAELSAFGDYLDLADRYDNVAVIKSFSYDYALAGLGFCLICAHNDIVENIKKISIPCGVSVVTLHCANAVLNNEKYIEDVKKQNIIARNLLYDGLIEKGFKSYKSEGNFILCDFGDYCDFYYKKLKNNGVLTKKYDKTSVYSSCLQITVPKTGGVKYILELLNKKDLIIFDLDGVVFDIRESYTNAIIQTFKHFAGFEVSQDEISHTKNLGGYNCDWNTVQYLLEQHGYYIELNEIAKVFQNLFYNPKLKDCEFLIDREKLLITKDDFEKLSKKYDLVIFTGRLDFEMKYSLEKFEIDKYFSYSINADDLDDEHLKPDPKGVYEILKHCPHNSVKYIGDSVDDIIAGNKAGVETIGMISPGANHSSMMNNFKHLCANHIFADTNRLINFLQKNEQI